MLIKYRQKNIFFILLLLLFGAFFLAIFSLKNIFLPRPVSAAPACVFWRGADINQINPTPIITLPIAQNSCLTQPGPTVNISRDQLIRLDTRGSPLAQSTKVDARDAFWITQWPVQDSFNYPVLIAGGPNVCFSGGIIIGMYPEQIYPDPHSTWDYLHSTSAMSLFAADSTIENMLIGNFGDGIGIKNGASNFTIRGVYLGFIRDDCVENDWLYGGLIDDSVFDGCYSTFSARTYAGQNPPAVDGSNDVWTIQNSLIRLEATSGVYQNRGLVPGHDGFFKWDESGISPQLVLNNNIFRADQPANNVGLGIPVEKLTECSNNTVVWLGSGSYPDPLPATFNGKSCFTITSDVSVWDKAVDDWISRRTSGDTTVTPTSSLTPTPNRSPSPAALTPTPTTPAGEPYRAFSSDSWWNTPIPANAPIDPNSAKYIADSLNLSHTQNYLRFTAAPGTTQGFGQPIFWASSSDKLYTVTDGSRTVQVHIPSGARPATGSDSQITIYDLSSDQVVGMSGASYDSVSDSWTVGGSIDRYILSSNGLDSKAAGSNNSRNTGHRGVSSTVRAVRVDEVQKGVIRHRLACFWWATGTQDVNHYWPMVGDEGAKGGIVPEGIVVRIKPSVNLTARGLNPPALVIAKALQDYGCLVGDNSGSGNRLKLELNEAAWSQLGIRENSLEAIPWSDWEFIQGGYSIPTLSQATPSISVQPSVIALSPTPLPTSSLTLPPRPTSTPGPVGSGIWISKEEVALLPISGEPGCDSLCSNAWNAIVSYADSSWGTPNLSDYAGLGHSIRIWAGALAAAKFSTMPGRQVEAQNYYDKVVQGLTDVMGTEAPALPASGGGKDDGSLAIARQFPRYVVAADLLGINDWGAGYKGYKNYVDYMLKTKFTFRVGDGGHSLAEGGGKCASNGCAMAQAARTAAAAYLKDKAQLDDAWLTFRRYSGDYSSPVTINFSSAGKNWYHDNNAKLAINPKGATCAGTNYPADGVLPNDQGRGGNCPNSPNIAPGYTQYPWEGLQGAYATAYMLYRLGYTDGAGKDPFQINDNALLRAVQYQWSLQQKFGGSWYDAGRAAWVKHLANYFYGFNPVNYNASDGGRNMGLTQWTLRR